MAHLEKWPDNPELDQDLRDADDGSDYYACANLDAQERVGGILSNRILSFFPYVR